MCGEAVVLITNGKPVGRGVNFPGKWYRADGTCYRIKCVHKDPAQQRACGRVIGVCTEEVYEAASAWVVLFIADFIRRIDVLVTEPAQDPEPAPTTPPRRSPCTAVPTRP